MARKTRKPAAPQFKSTLPYVTRNQYDQVRAEFELGVVGSFTYDGCRFDVWETEDAETGTPFVAIMACYDYSGDYMDIVPEAEARERGWIA